MYLPGFSELSTIEQRDFRRCMHRLMYEGSLQRSLPEDRDDYLLLQQYHQIAEFILELTDSRLQVDETHGLIYYEPVEDQRGIRRITSVDALTLLMLMRQELEIQYQASHEPSGTILVHELFRRYEAERGKLSSKGRFRDLLREFKRSKIVHYSGSPEEGDTLIMLLPLLFLLTPAKLDEIAKALQAIPSKSEESQKE